jgi:hypothetical protein
MARGVDDLSGKLILAGVIIVGISSHPKQALDNPPSPPIAVLTVTMYLGVSNFQRAISIVIPRSRSAFNLSSTQADKRCEKKNDQRLENAEGRGKEYLPYLKEPLPSSAASFSNFSMVRLSMPPHL